MMYVFYDDGLVPCSWQAKDTAVSTVSQLLSVSEDVFQKTPGVPNNDDAFTT